MSKVLKSLLWTRGSATGGGIAGRKRRKFIGEIFSEYFLCVKHEEAVTAAVASTYSLAVA